MDIVDPDRIDFLGITKNDKTAFEHLFRRYYKTLCLYAVGILKDRELAEDSVQEVLSGFGKIGMCVK